MSQACVRLPPVRRVERRRHYDVLADGVVVGRIMKAAAAPEGTPWLWTLASGQQRWEARTALRSIGLDDLILISLFHRRLPCILTPG